MKLLPTSRTFIVTGAVFGFFSVGFGAFGAHAIKGTISPDLLTIYQTAVDYQFFHALGLILTGLVFQHQPHKLILIAGWLIIAGIFVFSGSLYFLSLTGIRWLGAITPVGGTAFIAAWLLLAIGTLKKDS